MNRDRRLRLMLELSEQASQRGVSYEQLVLRQQRRNIFDLIDSGDMIAKLDEIAEINSQEPDVVFCGNPSILSQFFGAESK